MVAPASPADRSRITKGARALAKLGYRVEVLPQAFARRGHLAGTDRERAAALRKALGDASLRAIFFVRGGFGVTRLLPLIERDLVAADPKILVGYSDTTALLAFVTGKLGWVTFHGPMVATDLPTLSAKDRRALTRALRGALPQPIAFRSVIRPGVAEGRLIGGCLSVLVSLLGTPYAADFAGRIVFLEDVNEEPYKLDRMLTQLRQAGALRKVRGIVFGEMAACGARSEVLRVLAERTRDLGVPVGFGLPSGHGRGKHTLPLGVRARLDTNRRRLEILEPGTLHP
ncbi:MAG: S66 peptidase family protein [Candidatus Binatia bacterium]